MAVATGADGAATAATWLRADIASARRATTFLAVLLTGSLLVNVVLAFLTVRLSDRERVVLVPPTINKTFWVESERVSAEYLQQMAYFLMQLTLDVTPHSVDHQASVLMQYAAPASFGELRTAMAATADRLKRDGASTVFSARDLVVDEATQRVGVRGQLTTYVSDRRVSEVSKGYAIELQYAGGRIFLKAFRETSPNDPLEIQAQSQLRLAPAPARAGLGGSAAMSAADHWETLARHSPLVILADLDGHDAKVLSAVFSPDGAHLTTESANTFIGVQANGAPGINNATAIGAGASVTQSDSVVLGNNDGTFGASVATLAASLVVPLVDWVRLDLQRQDALDEHELAALRAQGCHVFQGFLFSPPMTPEEVAAAGFGIRCKLGHYPLASR